MPLNFLSLATEIRNQIYIDVLVLETPIPYPKGFHLIKNHHYFNLLTLGLLRANRIIYLEACWFLYSQNQFDFSNCTVYDMASFLEKIGPINASYISSICIDFPKFEFLDMSKRLNAVLNYDDIRILATIKRNFINLKKIEMPLRSTNNAERHLKALHDLKLAEEILELVDTHFKGMSGLKETVVNVRGKRRKGIRKKMERFGWTIRVVEDGPQNFELCYAGCDFFDAYLEELEDAASDGS